MKKAGLILSLLMAISFGCEKSLTIASFTTNKNIYEVDETVFCENTSLNADRYGWSTYKAVGNDFNFTTNYDKPGTYEITLIAYGSANSTFSKSVIVVSKKKYATMLKSGLYYNIQ